MSQNILPVNLANLAVGASGNVQLPTVTSDKGYTLYLFNESGSGLNILFFDSGDTHILPAGAWRPFALNPGEEAFTWTITYVLPGAPVTQLYGTLYMPGEPVPNIAVLGNSPIGIGGTVATSSVQTLSNEGNPANTLVVDIGTVTISQLVQLFTDHFLWSVQQAGVAHQVLKGQTAGNALQIGQSGDTAEFLGSLLMDNNQFIQFLNAAGAVKNILGVDGSDNLILRQSSGNLLQFKTVLNAVIATLNNTGDLTVNGLFKAASTLFQVDASGNISNVGFANLEPATPPVLNGSTSGTITIYQITRGNTKITMIVYNNFRNGGASVQTIGLPVGYTNRAHFMTSDVNGHTWRVGSGGADITNHAIITALAAGGGTSTLTTVVSNWSFGELRGPFDTLAATSGNTTARSGMIHIIGQ